MLVVDTETEYCGWCWPMGVGHTVYSVPAITRWAGNQRDSIQPRLAHQTRGARASYGVRDRILSGETKDDM